MRRVYAVIGIWFAVTVVTTCAFGGPIRVRVENVPKEVIAGQPYVVNLIVTRYGRRLQHEHPVVTIHSRGREYAFRASEAGHDGIYRVRVLVPLPGKWSYDVQVDGRRRKQGTLAAKLVAPDG